MKHVIIFSCRWTDLPNMPTARYNASALCVQSTPDAVLVVGGWDMFSSEAARCAELLIHAAGTSAGVEGACDGAS